MAEYTTELFSAGLDVYLLAFEPNAHDYFYNPEDLRPIAKIKVLFAGNDGSVYRLRPRAGT